jgi:hypothetical protein
VIADHLWIELASVGATALCDGEPSQGNGEAGESLIKCSDGLAFAVVAIRTVTPEAVRRLYLQRPACATVPCTEDELSTARVGAWTATRTFSVQLDARLGTVPVPVEGNDAAWPRPGISAAPRVARPSFKGAPHEVAERDPYPFCGQAEFREPVVLACFRDGVLVGRPVEMVARLHGTEGADLLEIRRYAGSGPLIGYQHDQTVGQDGRAANIWRRDAGAMILGIDPSSWDFDPWWGTEQKL